MHGLEYINELVMMADNVGMYYVLQDANYNVIALLDATYADFMTDYDPYGQMRWRSNAPGSSWIEHEYNPAAPVYNYDLPGFQGGTQDRETGLICFGARCYDPDLGRWLQSDPNGTGLTVTSGTRYHGEMPRPSPWVRTKSQFTDGANLYQLLDGNPITRRDPSGLFSYAELLSTSAIQGAMGGMINGMVSRFAGGSFWSGFASGAIGSALGGGAGYAFAASRAGFVGSAVAGRLVEGFAEGAGESYYSSHDLKSSLVDGLWGAAMNVAVGRAFELTGKAVRALGIADALDDWRPRRKNSELPAYGPGSFRDLLVKAWGIDPGDGYHAHHVFPLALADKFKKLFPDLDLDNPRYGAWWEAKSHVDNSPAYEDIWRDVLDGNPTFDEVLTMAWELGQDFGFQVNWHR